MSLGPVSTFLEEDLRSWVRRHGVVVWLDLDGYYTGFVDALAAQRAAGQLPYAVHGFRGSHLALLLELEHVAGGVERSPLVVHLPGFNEETVRLTPLFELYSAGVRYRKKLDTLVTEAASGRVRPEHIAAFKESGATTLAAADAWLAGVLQEWAGGGLAAQLQAMRLPALVDDLLGSGFIAGRLREPEAMDAVWERLATLTGLPESWQTSAFPAGAPRASDVAFVASSWALAVEYVHDLRRAPAAARLAEAKTLPPGVVDACRELASHLRDRHAPFYQRTADETEGWLEDEVAVARAEDLGKIDTFRFEEDRVLEAALSALAEEEWPSVLDWAKSRIDGGSFWLRQDPSRRAAWQLIQDAGRLGAALAAAGTRLRADTLDEAMERYIATGAAVDQAHRHLEQRRTALLYPQIPRFELVRARLDELRGLWRIWADNLAWEFSQLCRRVGFLPSPGLQQRSLFDEVVRPLTQEAGTTALFVVDALRFEMGEELFRAIEGTAASNVQLRGRLAELPTVTAVGMNALAPVASGGRLRPAVANGAFKGFSTGEYRVTSPETRGRAMWERVGGATCPWVTLAEVVSRDTTSLKQAIARARLVVVHSTEIDDGGETGVGPAVFDHVMQKLRAAWQLLREAGVRRFVFTADHGFLLLDDGAVRAQAHGRKVDPSRRHVLSPVAADHTNEARVSLADLGYDDTERSFLMFPASTSVFDTGTRGSSFVHGGNSLQERVIPVLTVVHRAATGSDSLRYTVSASAREGVLGMHCLAARLDVAAQGALAFGGTREVELTLRVVEDVSATVELCQVRGGARLHAGAILAPVGEEFELFFKLSGPGDARVRVELLHPAALADVSPCIVDARFAVSGAGRASPAPRAGTEAGSGWLADLPEGVRQLFEHLSAHGAVTEAEATTMLGSGRALRQFSARFEEYAARAPFGVRIDAVAGVKRYVREGSNR